MKCNHMEIPVKRRICVFCETWESGGIESFINSILLHMDLSGLVIDLVAAEFHNSVFRRGLEAIGVSFVELSGKQKNVAANHRLFRKLLAERRYDVIHLNVFQGMSLYYAELAKRAGVPVRIAHSHNTALRKSVTRPLKLILHNFYRRHYTRSATHLWACSSAAAEFMFPAEELEKRDYQFIPNGIDTEQFRFCQEGRNRVRRELGLDGKFVIGNVGRLCYQKNQAFLLDVMAEVVKHRPTATLLLIGEGPDKKSLERKTEKLGLQNNVVFFGVSNHVEELLWAMDVFVFPSRFEGLGIVAIEAQAAGLPVVCSEYVPEEVDVSDQIVRVLLKAGSNAWAENVLALYSIAHFDKSNSKASIFSIQDVAQKIEHIYYKERK